MIKKVFCLVFFSFSLYSSNNNNIDEIKKDSDTPPIVRSWNQKRIFLNNHELKYDSFEKVQTFSTDFLKTDVPLLVHYKFKNNEVLDIYVDNYQQIELKNLSDVNLIKEKFKTKYKGIFSHMETTFFESEVNSLAHYCFNILSCIQFLKDYSANQKSRKNKKEIQKTAIKINKNLKNYRSVYIRLFPQFLPFNIKMEPPFVLKETQDWFIKQYLETLLGKNYIDSKK